MMKSGAILLLSVKNLFKKFGGIKKHNYICSDFLNEKDMLQTNSYLADRYFNLLKPLNAETKLRIVTMLVDSITAEQKEEATSQKSVFDLYGVWANDPKADMIEKTIREGRKDPHTRTIASFE